MINPARHPINLIQNTCYGCFAWSGSGAISETGKLAAILAADVGGFSRLTATDEERTIARLPGLRTDLIDRGISVHHGHAV